MLLLLLLLLASEGASQILKKITGGQIFRVPNQHLFRLAMLSELLNKGQIRDLGKAHKDGSDMLFKITQKQVGNGIGTILASIGIPMILDAFKGRGMSGGSGPRISDFHITHNAFGFPHKILHKLLSSIPKCI